MANEPRPRWPRASVASAAAALLFYAGCASWITWPLVAHLATNVPQAGPDNWLLAWALSEESHALIGGATTALGGIYHPTCDALYYGEAAFGALPLFFPPYLLTGNPALALSLTFLGGAVLTAWGLHLVVARWTDSHLAGGLAGWTYFMTPWVLHTWSRQAPNYAVLEYFPVVMALLAAPTLTRARVILLGAAVAAQGLVSAYLAAAVIAPTAATAVARVARAQTRRSGLRLLLAVLAALAVLGVAFDGYRRVHAANPHFEQQTVWPLARTLTLRLPDDLLDPNPRSPLSLPGACAPLIVLGALARRGSGTKEPDGRWRQGTLWLALGLIFGLGAHLKIGETVWRTPLGILADNVPLLGLMRAPTRLGVLAILGTAVLTGLGFAACADRVTEMVRDRRVGVAMHLALACVAAIGIYQHHLPRLAAGRSKIAVAARGALYVNRFREPPPPSPFMAVLVSSGGALLELPVGPGVEPHAEAMYQAIAHRRPLLNGYSGYWPASFPGRMAIACALPDPLAVELLHRQTDMELILVHLAARKALDSAGLPPYGCPKAAARAAAWAAIVDRHDRPDLELVARAGDDVLFRVKGISDGPPSFPEQ